MPELDDDIMRKAKASAAEELVLKAAGIAKELNATESAIASNRIKEAVREVLTEGNKEELLLNIKRVPFICNEIKGIHDVLKEGKETFKDIKDNYVTKDSFRPLTIAVYGIYAFISALIVTLIMVKFGK